MNQENDSGSINKLKYVENDWSQPKLKYPFSVLFIVSNEFCERFCYYGMRSILTLYLVNILAFPKSDATVIYHAFIMMVYFFPLIGAIISDSYLGKFRTIFYVSMIYATGSIILSISAIPSLGLPMKGTAIFGLALIAIGTGGIKPCVSAFGGDQFVLPQQANLLAMFFSLFYFAINAGSLLSTFLTPVLREDVHCFGNTSCYPLAFGVPGILMIVSIVIFGLGKPLYKIKKPEGNIVLKVFKCMGNAVSIKVKTKETKDHWLDHATNKYGETFVNDIKATLKVLVLYTPLPIFWALYDQQGTAWTFQAVRMDGNIGFYTVLPDQFQLINPLLIIIFIPIFQYAVYPAFQKIGLLRSPLEKMTWGGFLAAVAFVVSGWISLKIEGTDPILPADGISQVRFYNTLPCDISILSTEPCSIREDLNDIVKSMDYVEILDLKMKHELTRNVKFSYHAKCLGGENITTTFEVSNAATSLAYFTSGGLISDKDDITKDKGSGFPYLRTITNRSPTDKLVHILFLNSANDVTSVNNTYTDRLKLSNGRYQVIIVDSVKADKAIANLTLEELKKLGSDITINLELGGVYTLMLQLSEENRIEEHTLVTVTQPNAISMMWLFPQYIIITAAEILFSITGLEFSYSQAPVSMKSVLTASFLLTNSFGNLIVVIIESVKVFDKASYDFFLYAALMVADMLIFAYLASKYQYVNFEKNDEQMKLDNENNILKSKSEMSLENPGFSSHDET